MPRDYGATKKSCFSKSFASTLWVRGSCTTSGFDMLPVCGTIRRVLTKVRGALETLVSALTPIDHGRASKNEVQPALMNTDLLSREVESISLLLNLLSEEDFYVRYYPLQILTALLTNSQNRLPEAILTIPRGITRLMDMLMDREVIRNEELLLLTYLTREAEIELLGFLNGR